MENCLEESKEGKGVALIKYFVDFLTMKLP